MCIGDEKLLNELLNQITTLNDLSFNHPELKKQIKSLSLIVKKILKIETPC